MKRFAPAFLALLAGCGGLVANGGGDASDEVAPTLPAVASSDAGSEGHALDASNALDASVAPDTSFLDAGSAGDASGEDGSATSVLPPGCADAAVPPTTLECTGLYADFASQTISPNAQPYAPAVPLWSDGAVKERWIELPPGQKIDISDPSEWTFPVGTKLFKQFTYEGVRVETRMFQKIASHTWVHATYEWSADQTSTSISYGDTVPVDSDGGTWIIPTPEDCDSCHGGRLDRILGFEQVSLGLSGATGLTLPQLVAQDLVTPVPTQVNLTVGDDGTGLAAPALSWLHINCGVSCHNSNESAEAYGAKMILRLDPTVLDGSPATLDWDPLQTTIGVPCVSGAVAGVPRILPGDPSASAIVQLISMRGVLQMPPIASRIVDTTDVAKLVDWIQHMPSEAGVQEAGVDATVAPEAGYAASASDGGLPEGSNEAGDAGAVDATIVDAEADVVVVDAPSAEDAPAAADVDYSAAPEAQASLGDGEAE